MCKTFESFIVDNFNRDAFSAAYALATRSETCNIPIFIIGESGLGKTHLAEAVINHCNTISPSRPALKISGEEAAELIASTIRHYSSAELREIWPSNSILILDDISVFRGKLALQQAMFRLIADATPSQHALMTSTFPASDFSFLSPRVRNIAIKHPDFEAKRKILQHKVTEYNLQLSDAELDKIARGSDNIRKIEGILRFKEFCKKNQIPSNNQ